MRALILTLLFALSCVNEQLGDDASSSDGAADSGLAKDAAVEDAAPADAEAIDAEAMDAEPIDAAAPDADAIDAEPADADSTDAQADSGVRDCAAIEAEYQALVSTMGCQDFQQCQVVNGHCAVGLGGCWYTVNNTVSQTALDALAAEYVQMGCTGGVCRCTAPPNDAICDQGICMPAP